MSVRYVLLYSCSKYVVENGIKEHKSSEKCEGWTRIKKIDLVGMNDYDGFFT